MSKFSLFGSDSEKDQDANSQTEIENRLEQLSEQMTRLKMRVNKLEERVKELEERPMNEPETVSEPVKDDIQPEEQPSPTTIHQFYLAAPDASGCFTAYSTTEKIGQSIYLLTTQDGVQGSFILLDTPDAIATAMISVSQFIKPVCKVIGNSAVRPSHIITDEEGLATWDGASWKVIRKALIRLE